MTEWKDAPTEPGWWWCWEPQRGARVAHVQDDYVYMPGVEAEFDVGDFPRARWLGPLTPPEPPES